MSKRRPIDGGPKVVSSEQALRLLFNERNPEKPFKADRYWEPWQKPKPALPIDECISELIEGNGRKGAPKIVSKTDFRRIGLKNGDFSPYDCPYEIARHYLARAVGLAYDDIEADRFRREDVPSELDKIKEWSNQAIVKIERIIKQVQTTGLDPAPEIYVDKENKNARWHGYGETREGVSELRAAIEKIRAVAAKADAKRESTSKGGRREQVWWVSFVIRCGMLWGMLTGIVPEKGHASFERFLSAANESFGGSRHSFDSQLDTALAYLNEMDEWNKLDARHKGINAPGETSLLILGPLGPDIMRSRMWLKIAKLVVRSEQGDTESAEQLKIYYDEFDKEGRDKIDDLIGRYHSYAG